MNAVQTIISLIFALIFLPTSIVAGIVFVLRKFFEQALSRDIENYKATLELEAQSSKARLENELQAKLFEYQTKFSFHHQKQTEVIGELYGLLREAVGSVSDLVNPLQLGGGNSPGEKFKETNVKCLTLQSFFIKHRIYLDEDVCDKIDSVLQHMHQALVRFDISQNPSLNPAPDIVMWRDAWKQMQEEVPPVLKALESQFRRSLSAIPNNES
jgi:hypothetical protein